MGKKGNSKKTNNSTNNNTNGYNTARSKKVKLLVKNPFADLVVHPEPSQEQQQGHPILPLTAASFAAAHQQQEEQRQPRNYNPFSNIFGASNNEEGEGDEDSNEDDEESVVKARREALAALDPYNANAHKEHFKSLKAPKQQQEQPDQENRVAIEDDILPPSPSSRPTLIAVSTPPTSRTQHQKRESLRSSLYSTPKTQIIQRPRSRNTTRHYNQDDDTLVPEISISLATPSPPSSASSNKRHHRRGSSLSYFNPALLTTTFTPSPLSVLSPLDEEFDRVEATKKDKSNRSTAIYTNLFQRITSFGTLSSGKGAEEEVVDHIGAEMRKSPTAPRSKPISTSWSLKRSTFGTTTGGGTNSSDLSDNQSSRFNLHGKKKKKGSTKKPRKHGVAAVMDSLDPWDSCDDMLLQGTDDEELYDGGVYGSSLSNQSLKGRMGGRRRSSDDATTTAESEQGVIPRLGKGAMAGMEDWMMYPRTAAIRGSFNKIHRDVPFPATVIPSTATSDSRKSHQGIMRPVSLSAEYTTISLASPPTTVYSSQALGGGHSAHDSTGNTSLDRTDSLDSFYHIKKGASKFLESLGGPTTHQNDLAKGQAKKSQDHDEDARVRRMMNGDQDAYDEQGHEFDHHEDNDNGDDDKDTDFSFRQHPDQRSSSMTFGPRKAVSPPPLATFSSFPSLRDFIHSATGLSRSSTVPIGSGMGNISPPPFSPTAYLRRSQTTTAAGFGGYADIQHGYSSSTSSTSAEGGRVSFSPVSRRKNISVMVPTVVVPKHIPGSGATAALSATPVSFSPPLGSSSTFSSTTTVMTSSDEDDFLSMAAVAARNTPPARTFQRLGPSTPLSASAPLTVPAKAATAANSTQLPSSLAAAAMAAAQRARAVYIHATASSTPIITLNRSNTSISVDSMTGPLTGNDYIGQFEKDRAQARNVGMVDEGPFGSMNRIDSNSSINTFSTTVNHPLPPPPHHHHGSSSALSYIPTSLSSTATLPVDLDDGHAKEMGKMAGRGVGNSSLRFGFPLGYFRRPSHNSNNDEEDNNDIGSIRRSRHVSAQSDISEKLMHLPEPSPFEGMCSCRGLINITSMFLILCGLILLILGYPIASSLKKDRLAAEATAAAASAALADELTQVKFALDSHQHYQHKQGAAGLVGSFSKTADSILPRVPRSAGMMVDPDTPEEKKTTVAKNGQPWDLVFSDEFNQDGRGFGPGQDSHWEAMNLAPSPPMGILEHYSSDKVTTRKGQLEITLHREPISPPGARVQRRDGSGAGSAWKYTSGMLQSWNKMCFQGGILEVAVSLPGNPSKAGLKPRVFVLGNLARYGFPATMDGVWPFSTPATPSQCGTTTSSPSNTTSLLVQRLNGCSSGADKLGRITRGAPEMTLLETHYGVQMDRSALEAQKREIQNQKVNQPAVLKRRQYSKTKRQVDQGQLAGEAVVLQRQSLGANRVIVDSPLGRRLASGGSSTGASPHQGVVMASVKVASSYSSAGTGSNTSSTVVVETSTPQWIQPVDTRFFSSSSSLSPNNDKDQGQFVKVGLEYWPGSMNSSTTNDPNDDAYIQFSLNNQRQPPLLATSSHSSSNAPTSNSNNNDWYKDSKSLPSTTVIPQEPMSIVLSLGLLQDELLLDPELSFPAVMKIDYIRLYQPRQDVNGKKDWASCDPEGHPTAAYIREHTRAYSDPGLGTWAEAGYA